MARTATAKAYPLVSEPDHGRDLGVAHHIREAEIVDIEAVSRGSVAPGMKVLVKRMLAECELDSLLIKGWISEPQWRAGMLFRVKWLACVRLPNITAQYGETSGRATQNPTDEVAARRATASQDVNEAIRVLGMIQSAAVIAICGMDEKPKGRLAVLRLGLEGLRVLYRVPADYERYSTKGR